MGLKRWDAIIYRLPTQTALLGAELGVWVGKTSKELLAALPLLHLVMVDRWVPPPEGDTYRHGDMPKYPMEKYIKAKNAAAGRVAPYRKRVTWLEMDTVKAADIFPGAPHQKLDFIFVDGDHSFEGTTADLEAWVPKVKPGGLVCGHDWDRPEKGQVKWAVTQYFKPGTDVELDCDHTWFVRLPK